MGTLLENARLAARQLRRNPGFTFTVVLTLGLAIGANTAIFSVVNAVLLQDLPYPNPERIATIFARGSGAVSFDERKNIDGEQWELLRDNVPSLLSAISGLRTSGVNLLAGRRVQYVQSGRISAHYLDVLGLGPVMGRNFSPDEDRPHGPKAAILSYDLWRTTFAQDPGVVGQTVRLKGEPYTIVGVLAEKAGTPLRADIYTPIQASREGEGQGTNFAPITRLGDKASWAQADAEMNRAWAHSARVERFASANPGSQLAYYSVPLKRGQTTALRPQVLALMMAAAFILLIACANLAGLTLVRLHRRIPEVATRLALGASGWQIQKQLWVENLVLALAGGVAGIVVGFWSLRGLLLMLPEHFLPVQSVHLDGRVLGFTLLISVVTSVLFGMLPALVTRKIDLRSAMASRGVIGSRSVGMRQGLIAGEVALTVVMLCAAGLVLRTLIHLETMPPGFNPHDILTAKASLDDVRYHDPSAFRALLNESLARMKAIAGVKDAAVGISLPFERALLSSVTLNDGRRAGQNVMTNQVYVTPGYFETFQIPVLRGRTFTEADGPDAQPVIVINQTFARKFFGEESPVGRHVGQKLVVGVVADTLLSSAARLNEGSAPLTDEEAIYVPAAQLSDAKLLAVTHMWFQPSWILRSSQPAEALIPKIQGALTSVDPDLPFSGFYSMSDLMAGTLATQRIEVALLTAMAFLALLLSAVGIFALVANMVAERRREIGIRIALGSTIEKAMLYIGGSGLRASALGLAVGLILCGGVLRILRSVLYGVAVYDLKTILSVVATLALVTLAATLLPALKVREIDPARTLHEE